MSEHSLKEEGSMALLNINIIEILNQTKTRRNSKMRVNADFRVNKSHLDFIISLKNNQTNIIHIFISRYFETEFIVKNYNKRDN